MENEIFLLIGLELLPVGKTLANSSYLEVETMQKVRELFNVPFNHWQVSHLGVNFVFIHPGDIDTQSQEISIKVLRAIHEWALRGRG